MTGYPRFTWRPTNLIGCRSFSARGKRTNQGCASRITTALPRLFRGGLLLAAAIGFFPSPVQAQGPLINGQNHRGTIAIPGQVDEWTFEAAKGDAIALSIGEVRTSEIDPGFAPWIRLIGPDNTQVGSRAGTLAAQVNVTAPLSGTYIVRAADSSINRPGSALGSYLLTLVKMPGDIKVPPDDEGGPLTAGANHAGLIRVGDLDPWTFQAAKGDAISVNIGEVRIGEVDPGFSPWIRLFGPDGKQLGSSPGTLAAQIDVTAPLTGVYTVLVADSDINRAGDATGNYLLTLIKTPGTFMVPDGDQGGQMVNGGKYPGSMYVGDLDPFSFAAAKNDAINLSIGEVRIGEVDPGFAPWIRLFGPDGKLLGSSAGTLAAQIDVTAPLTGTYTVLVSDSSINRAGDATGNYMLTLAMAPEPFVVPADDQGGPVTNNTNYEGAIYVGDLDQWSFVAGKGAPLLVKISEIVSGAIDPGFAPWIRLFGPDGSQLGSSAGNLTAQINLAAPLTGGYTVLVADSSINRAGDAMGKYLLSVTGLPDQPEAPVIRLHPVSQVVRAGQLVQFSAAASGNPTPTVQWQVSLNGGSNWGDSPGATSTTYSFVATRADNQKQFRAVFTNTGGSTPTLPATLTVVGRSNWSDLDGDGRADLTVWRPGDGTWYSVTSRTNYNQAAARGVQWGNKDQGDMQFLGDIDGDGLGDLIIWRPTTGTWYWLTSSTAYSEAHAGARQWGNQSLGDIPLVGDIDGDGKADLIVWRASTGTWFWLTSSTGYDDSRYGAKQWGNQSLGDIPMAADIDGDARADLVVWRASEGMWYWLTSSSGYDYGHLAGKQWGNQSLGDTPLMGDVDGDGTADLIVWRTSDDTWYWLTSSSGYDYGHLAGKQWGNHGLGDIPLLGDLDGDGQADLTVWRASTGTWYWLTSSSGFDYTVYGAAQWGNHDLGDMPTLR